jgi:hypothetical protein
MLLASPPAPPADVEDVVLTFEGPQSLPGLPPDLQRDWRRALRFVMNRRGWRVTHLLRLGEDRLRALALIPSFLDLIAPLGRYVPRCICQQTVPVPPQDFMVVPGVGALLCLATRQASHIDAALFLPDGESLDVVRGHLDQLRIETPPLARSYPPLSLAFVEAVTRLEEADGDWCMVLDGLSGHTVPVAVLEERAQALRTDDPEHLAAASAFIRLQRRRLAAVRERLATYRFRDLVPRRAVERLVSTGIYAVDDFLLALGCPPETPSQRERHLRALLDLLDHPNYELALLDDDERERMGTTFFAAKRGRGVLLDVWPSPPQSGKGSVDVEIPDPVTAEAFCDYVGSMWSQLSSESTDKSSVRAWLQRQIDRLAGGEASMPGPTHARHTF